MSQPKLWMVVRLIECRLQFLTTAGNWDDLSVTTLVSDQRELVFQAGRKVNGLLMSANGLPRADVIEGFAHDCLQAYGVNITAE
jgi:hypothetical protein